MKVKALQAGFFGGSLRDVGQEFEVPAGTNGTWFLSIDEDVKAPTKAKAPAKAEPRSLSELAKAPALGSTDIA